MKIIYKMENKVNGKKYIGQTNDFTKRMNGHKSDAYNKNSHSYTTPLSNAIRKYGWENFENSIIEEIPDEESYLYIDEREQFFIQYYNSLTKQNGYNITIDGQGCPRKDISYEERLKLSKLFKPEEIKDIQSMLKQGITMGDIRTKYYPRLTKSLLNNINSGLNFKNDDWSYPLHNYNEDIHSVKFAEQEIDAIQQDIISGLNYRDIANKWNITIGFISGINNGQCWHKDNLNYPLYVKGHSKLHNMIWVKKVQEDLMYSKLNQMEIAQKYNKSYSTIKKINSGSSHRNSEYKYPLTSNRK